MKKIVITILCVSIQYISLGQQLINGDFEKWTYINTFANGDSAFKPSNWTLYNRSAREPNYYGDRAPHPKNGDRYSIYIQSLGGDISGKGYTSFLTYGNTVGKKSDIKPWKWGVPYTTRPTKVMGEYKYYIYQKEDSGYAYILLKKYNQQSKKSDTIGYGTYTFPKSSVNFDPYDSADYTPFSMVIKYRDETIKPDTMVLVFSNTKYQEFGLNVIDGGLFFIDNVSLVESTTSISTANLTEISLNIYPNPTNATLGIQTNLQIARIVVYQSNGIKVLESKATDNLEVSVLPEGLYLLEVWNTEGRRLLKKFQKGGL